jgi:hypothetical protein
VEHATVLSVAHWDGCLAKGPLVKAYVVALLTSQRIYVPILDS